MPKQKRTQSEVCDLEHSNTHQHSRKKGDLSSKPQKHHWKNPRKGAKYEASTEISGHEVDPIFSGHPKSIHILSSPSPIRQALLSWYATVETNRGMPWRKPYNPNLGSKERAQRAYEVWVSEVMLQQTQVITVIPYYNTWMKKFPTVAHLAKSSVDEVNALWKGLGYYSRGRRLLDAAQIIIRDYRGKLPDNAKEMGANIPGIGRYSAGAISSIAYGERVPVLDGNVHRLLSRFLALHALPKSKATLDTLWAAATAMVKDEVNDMDHPGDINQALIELGSTICKIRNPSCSDCPLNAWCGAYNKPKRQQSVPDIEDLCTLCEPLTEEQNGVTAYPMKVKKRKARIEVDAVSVIEWRSVDDRQFLLVRRPDNGLLAGLYEFPATSLDSNHTLNGPGLALQQLLDVVEDSVTSYNEEFPRGFQREYSGASEYHMVDVVPMGNVLHTFSHIKKTYLAQWVVIEGGIKPPQLKCGPGQPELNHEECRTSRNALWLSISEITKANISTGVSKIWKLFLTMGEQESNCSVSTQ
ncbi:DNA glycosylase [Lentinula detonsa]|uniref:Adenine DNA glycosylase n=1 Tax=Lentinula detonsa TaxID=2804962 RepID=A0AA38Q2F1_9AGAR|nr:DNA glycosylase [Lentinula detonsa]